jgi:hypothetical protein
LTGLVVVQRQFTAERWSRDGAPDGAFDYRFR